MYSYAIAGSKVANFLFQKPYVLYVIQGNELQIRQAHLYLREGEELSFYEVLLRARQRREVMIGYRLADAERAVINPPAKNERRRWSVKDVFVVIAEKE